MGFRLSFCKLKKQGGKSMNGKWIEVKIITKSEAIEPITGIFYSLGVKGVAIEDPNDININQQNPLSWDFADSDIFEYGGKAAVVKAYFSNEDDINKITKYIKDKLKELNDSGFDIGEGKVIINPVYEEDWANEWKKYYKTIKIGKKIVVNPLWIKYTPKKDEILVKMDPSMAFGTGTHETTMMCIEMLEKYIKENDVVYDIGTGSGILAISASKLGAKNVIGVDLNEIAVEAARENVKRNEIDNVKIIHGNLVDVLNGKANIVVANIIADVIIDLSNKVDRYLVNDGLFIASGIIKDRKDDVIKALKSQGFNVLEVKEMGEWVAVVSQK